MDDPQFLAGEAGVENEILLPPLNQSIYGLIQVAGGTDALGNMSDSDDEGGEVQERLMPLLDRKLEAQARAMNTPTIDLRSAVANIFDFDEAEDVIVEYTCWLMQMVPVDGFMYITRRHICFYAYTPKKEDGNIKTGWLSKQGRQNPRFRRSWFSLKGDVLSYYNNDTDQYFPRGIIDLRTGISAELYGEKPTKQFRIETDTRVYHFKADNAASAEDWVRRLQKALFRSHNDGDAVKLVIPTVNILDIDGQAMLMDKIDTIKLKVIENDETYAVDEYFFSGFKAGPEVLQLLKNLSDNRLPSNDAVRATTTLKANPRRSNSSRRVSPARSSRELHRGRSSFERPRQRDSGSSERSLPRKSDSSERPRDQSRSSVEQLQQGEVARLSRLQQARLICGRITSKAALSYLSSSPKEYIQKFAGAMSGGRRHYNGDDVEAEQSFRDHFGLDVTEQLRAVFFCWLHRVVPIYGKIYIGTKHFCFRSLIYGVKTKMKVPLDSLINVTTERGWRLGYSGMLVVLRGREEVFFDFGSREHRDDCVSTAAWALERPQLVIENTEAAAEYELLRKMRTQKDDEVDGPVFDDTEASIIDIRPEKSLRITCLTIGTRGDVQPYIALCKRLAADGHRVRIATHAEFEPWVRKHGIDFASVEGDPSVLMQMCVEKGMFTPSFVYETNRNFRGWLDGLLASAWRACQKTDLLIESPSAMAGIHIAEALRIPYFRSFSMPWTRTRAYPHAFAVPARRKGGQYNYMSYVIFEYVFWRMTCGQINRWRQDTLGLAPTSVERMAADRVPFLYHLSPNVMTPPVDFGAWVRVTGYWFLDEGVKWEPPKELTDFISRARKDKMAVVYVGFGSVILGDTLSLTQDIIEAVRKAGVRCILSRGWSDRMAKQEKEIVLPKDIHAIQGAPHDWLFTQVDAAVHHGGSGTTGASLRAGIPTVVRPFFGDQFFSATRVEDLGVGVAVRTCNATSLGKAMFMATRDENMRRRAKILGEKIRAEDGVGRAVEAIYRDLEYARSLVAEEDWTFISPDD